MGPVAAGQGALQLRHLVLKPRPLGKGGHTLTEFPVFLQCGPQGRKGGENLRG